MCRVPSRPLTDNVSIEHKPQVILSGGPPVDRMTISHNLSDKTQPFGINVDTRLKDEHWLFVRHLGPLFVGKIVYDFSQGV